MPKKPHARQWNSR